MLLEVQDLTKSFGALRVTDSISLSLNEGESLGIIGPNGAGKSTLFNLIAGAIAPNSGRILLDGRDITTMPAARRCQAGIGRSFQIPKPWAGLTVYENLLVAAEFGAGDSMAVARPHCLEILDRLGLAALADTPAGKLRLLERKRLELARGLATRPRLLLLDEIAGGLTDLECESLIETIRLVQRQGVAIIWIEHVVRALLAVVDRLAVISFGAKIAEGEPHAIFNSRAVQELYLGLEA